MAEIMKGRYKGIKKMKPTFTRIYHEDGTTEDILPGKRSSEDTFNERMSKIIAIDVAKGEKSEK